jgi:two-component system response regulator YesN
MYRLLIADDEQLEREAIRFIVRENFPGVFEICEAANGREAVELACSFQPNLIFLDIKMPGINGLEAAAQINGILPECRMIIITAYHYFNYAKEALSLGMADYITKPAPVETVVAAVQRVMASFAEKHTKKQLDEERERRLKLITQYFEDDLLVLIAYGEMEEKVIEEYFAGLSIQYQAFLAVVASISYPAASAKVISEIEKRALKKQLVERVKSYFQKTGIHAFIRFIGPEVYILVLFDEYPDEYQSRVMGIQLFSDLKDDIMNELSIPLTVGIGNACNCVPEIYHAFLQAKSALHYETTSGSIISFGDIQKGNRQTIYPLAKEKRLHQSILQGELKSSLQLLDDLLDWIDGNTAQFETYRQKVYELLLVLTRETITNTSFTEFDTDTKKLYQTISLLNQKEELGLFARDYISKQIVEINTMKTSRANALVSRVIEYMEQNYHKDLSLEEVAAFIQISPFYLSKIFKKTMGENFIDYLTGFRIQKAQELLADPLLTMKDICYQVGYKDPNYFARVFKKTCGVSPSEFQAKKLR